MNRSVVAPLAAAALLATAGTALADGGPRAATAWPGSAALAGAWSGTAASTAKAGFTFPVQATIAVAATGRPSGRVVLGAPVNCAGTWAPISRSGRVFLFAEDVSPTGQGSCIDEGRVQLSAASGGRLRYVWTKGDAGSVAYLDPVGVSGSWTGTLSQAGLPPVKMSLRVNGVRAGGLAGQSRYGAPLSCHGRLTPVGRGTQAAARLVETITSSGSTSCVGVGSMTLRIRDDGRLAYRWQGGDLISTAVLRRAG